MLNRDTLNHIPAATAATDAVAVIDRLQDMDPERQMLALATTFKLMAERFKIPGNDIMTVADNVIHGADCKRVEFDAVTAYLENEL